MLSKLILLHNNKVVSEYEIDQETFSIGRKPENDLIIDNMAVSGRHARILMIGNEAFIEDLQSTNGTLINNQRISKQMLRDGDTIVIGQQVIRYVAVKLNEADQDKTVVIKPYAIGMEGTAAFSKAAPQAQTHEPESRPITSSSTEQNAQLQLLSGPQSGKKMFLTKSISRLGKPGEQVAAIARRPGGYFIMHLGGNTPQPLLNDEPVSTQATLLSDGDIIEVGKIRMKFALV